MGFLPATRSRVEYGYFLSPFNLITMAKQNSTAQFDLSKLSNEDFRALSNQVIARLAQTAQVTEFVKPGEEAVHDSHSSSHGKNSITLDDIMMSGKVTRPQ